MNIYITHGGLTPNSLNFAYGDFGEQDQNRSMIGYPPTQVILCFSGDPLNESINIQARAERLVKNIRTTETPWQIHDAGKYNPPLSLCTYASNFNGEL